MAKTLNQFLEGYLKVKNPDEQKFVDKHVVAKHSDRNGNDDDAFKGKTKQIDRRKERHGYNPGEDEKVYEELKGDQHKLDANKNGKLDAHDFKLLRKKKMKEEIDSDLESELKAQRQTKKSLAAAKERRQAFSRANNVADMRKYAKEEADLQEGDGTGTYSVNSKHKKHNELVKAGFKHQAFKHGDGKVMHTYWSPGYRNADLQKVLGEEAEQIDELSRKTLGSYIKKAQGTVVTNTAAMVDSDSDLDRKTNAARKVGNRLKGVNSAVNRMTKEEAEQIDELSTATLQSYRKKARAQGNAIVDKMKMGGGDWSKDQKDTKTLRKRAAGAQASGKQLVKRGESLKTEEVEELDELSHDTLRRYRMKAKRIGDNEKGDIGYRAKGRDLAARKTHGGQYGIPKAKVMAKEEVEDLDENAKVVAHLQKRYGDNIRKSHVRSAANDFGVGYVALAHAVRKKLGVNRLEEEQVDEKLTAKTPMGTYIKDFQKSDAPQFKGKSKEKRRAMAIAAKLTAERGGKPLRKEEKLADLLGDLTESHRRTMLSVFDKLNEDNQKKFLEACQTPEGVEYMLDFSISHRGE